MFRMVLEQPLLPSARLGAIVRGGRCHERPHTAGKASENDAQFSKTAQNPGTKPKVPHSAQADRNEPPRGTYEKRISDAQLLCSARNNVDQNVRIRDDFLSLLKIVVSHDANSFHLVSRIE